MRRARVECRRNICQMQILHIVPVKILPDFPAERTFPRLGFFSLRGQDLARPHKDGAHQRLCRFRAASITFMHGQAKELQHLFVIITQLEQRHRILRQDAVWRPPDKLYPRDAEAVTRHAFRAAADFLMDDAGIQHDERPLARHITPASDAVDAVPSIDEQELCDVGMRMEIARHRGCGGIDIADILETRQPPGTEQRRRTMIQKTLQHSGLL